MATINNKLIHFKSKSDFDGRYAATTDGGKTYGDFLGTSIVFIQDAKQIWTHGQFYDANEATLASLGITATADELNYIGGVTSNVQTQLDEIKESVDSISDPYEINLTNLLSAEDSESISTAIGGIDNLNATVQDNRIIVGTISNGNVSVSIRILGNVTTLYYLLDSVIGLTLNEVAITNTSGTLSKSITTHSVLTENMVINSLESGETTLPLSAAQGKVLATDKQDKTDNTLNTENKTVVGAINEILPKATGVGMIDPESNGSGEVFNIYKGSYRNIASAMCSHAEGEKTTASGQMSHAEGRNTIASGFSSHAEGSNTEATGSYSHSEGVATIANNSGEHAEGFNNVSNTGETNNLRTRHSVGIGISSTNRKNAHEIMANGDHYIYGLGNYDGTNAIENTSKTLQEVINNKSDAFTAGTGLEFEGNTLNVTLDTTVFKVVSVLPFSPAQGDENKIFLVPTVNVSTLAPEIGTAVTHNEYTEYIWVDNAWEELGKYYSEVDLTLSNLGISATAAEINKLDGLATTATELGYVHGVTSNIQTQLNAKANTSSLSSYALKNGSNASGTWPISISGNAATATKLATSHSLWGQSFNGTNNVSGDMIGVGRINNGLIISQFGTSADNSDTTRFLINGHQLEFGGYGYAHQVYYFRPQYSANGETYADMYIQNASAADSPVFSTTHYFDHNGNAYHWGSLGLGGLPSSGYKLDVRGAGYFSGLLTAPGGLFGLTKAQADTYAGNSSYYNLAVGQKASSMGASLLMYRDSADYQSFIVWSTNTQDHIGIGLAPDSNDLTIENHKAGIQLKGTGNLTYNDYPLLHSGNYTSYTVTKTGGGASGTWNINISGAAASANSVAWNNVSGKPSSFTPAAHNHSAANITSGTLAIARIPTGTTASTVALGNHTHSQYLTSSSLSGYATQSWVNSQGFIKSATDTKNTTGTSNSASKLYLVGGALQSSTGIVTYSNSAVYTLNGQLFASQMNATNGFFETSDARLKDFKEDIKALDTVDRIPTKYFTWKENESKESQIGTSAQEVEKLYPELVSKTEDDTLTVDYAKLSIIALAAIKELKAEIQSLKEEIKQLKSK